MTCRLCKRDVLLIRYYLLPMTCKRGGRTLRTHITDVYAQQDDSFVIQRHVDVVLQVSVQVGVRQVLALTIPIDITIPHKRYEYHYPSASYHVREGARARATGSVCMCAGERARACERVCVHVCVRESARM